MSRPRLLLLGRIAFVLLTIAFAWWGFRGRWDEIGAALGDVSPLRVVASVLLTVAGLSLTAVLWRRLLAGLGSPVPLRQAAAIFFVGQIGKYIPGSVWTFAVQAHLGRRNQVPARSSVAASSIFLLIHTFSGVLLGASLAALGVIETDLPRWLWALAAAGSAAALAPSFLRWLGARIAGADASPELGLADVGVGLALMAAVWACYGAGVRLLVDPGDTKDLLLVVGAFALSHAAGVLLVLAPAGLGAREGVLIALLGPVTGVGTAAAVALLARLVHAVADFGVALLARAVAGAPPVETTAVRTHQEVA